MKSALSILAAEARRRGVTCGQLVAGTSERELASIISKAKELEGRESSGQRAKIQDLQGTADGG